jgi:NADP-reducing hydrogenase subunit HndB
MRKKINSPEALNQLRDRARAEFDLRDAPKETQITIHMGTCGIAAGARDVFAQLSTELFEAKVTNVTLRQSGCIGLCDREPMMSMTDREGARFIYGNLNKTKIHDIVQSHIIGGTPVLQYIIRT